MEAIIVGFQGGNGDTRETDVLGVLAVWCVKGIWRYWHDPY